MALDERDFFNNRNETRTDKLTCPRCKRTNDYQMRWVVRTRKDRIPPGADERDRALFGKLRDYMIRMDDSVTCKTCGKKFDIPSQHSMVFLRPDARPLNVASRRRNAKHAENAEPIFQRWRVHQYTYGKIFHGTVSL